MNTILKVIKKRIWRTQRILRSRLGIRSRMNSPDRRFQEDILFKTALADPNTHKVLYVGVAWYTFHYYKTFFRNAELTTLDCSSEQAIFGAKNHVIGGLDSPELASYGPFDTIFLLGVLNYGINDIHTFHAALVDLDRHLTGNACCYLTVEEDISGEKPASIRSDTMLETAHAMNFQVAPISEWFEIIGRRARTRFFVMARTPQVITQVLSRFSFQNH